MNSKEPQKRENRDSGARGSRLEIRLQLAEEAAFKEAAGISGISISAWARERLRWAAARELENARRPIRFLETKE